MSNSAMQFRMWIRSVCVSYLDIHAVYTSPKGNKSHLSNATQAKIQLESSIILRTWLEPVCVMQCVLKRSQLCV